MNSDVFEEWLKHHFLPVLSEPSVVVLKNASYHNRLLEKIFNSNTRQEEILQFLEKEVDIPVPV